MKKCTIKNIYNKISDNHIIFIIIKIPLQKVKKKKKMKIISLIYKILINLILINNKLQIKEFVLKKIRHEKLNNYR